MTSELSDMVNAICGECRKQSVTSSREIVSDLQVGIDEQHNDDDDCDDQIEVIWQKRRICWQERSW